MKTNNPETKQLSTPRPWSTPKEVRQVCLQLSITSEKNQQTLIEKVHSLKIQLTKPTANPRQLPPGPLERPPNKSGTGFGTTYVYPPPMLPKQRVFLHFLMFNDFNAYRKLSICTNPLAFPRCFPMFTIFFEAQPPATATLKLITQQTEAESLRDLPSHPAGQSWSPPDHHTTELLMLTGAPPLSTSHQLLLILPYTDFSP